VTGSEELPVASADDESAAAASVAPDHAARALTSARSTVMAPGFGVRLGGLLPSLCCGPAVRAAEADGAERLLEAESPLIAWPVDDALPLPLEAGPVVFASRVAPGPSAC
jgi:hypothetical protein